MGRKNLGYSKHFDLYLGKLEKDANNSEYIPQWTGTFGNLTSKEVFKAAFQYDYSDVRYENRYFLLLK